ncbi:MAG: LamG domain-containing protein [Candidatus Micrarchaeia archaeon]
MKTKVFFAISVFLLFAGIFHAAYPSGLVSYWPFDSNANDALGLNNGTVGGAALQATGGKVGGAYSFNGIDSYISMQPLGITTNTLSILAWVKGSATGNFTGIVFSRDPSQPFGLDINYNNSLAYTWNNNNASVYRWMSNLTPSVNNWNFIAITISPSNGTIYMSNSTGLYSASNVMPHILQALSTELRIGSDNYSSNRFFNGSIDEVAIFNRTLSASEISQFYNASKNGYRDYFGECVGSCPAFGSGTPPAGSTLASRSVFANITLNPPSSLRSFTFNWNGTNYSFYDPSLVGMWSFEEGTLSDNFNAAPVSASRWNVSPSASISSSRLMTATGTGSWENAGVTSKYPLSGDYDMQMDFDASGWGTPATQWNAFFGIITPLDAVVCYYSKSSDGTKRYYSWDQTAGSSLGGTATLSDTSGKIRITRVGSNVSCYYYNSGWILYASRASSNFAGDTYPYLMTGNRDSGQAVTTYFDNFIVSKGQGFSDSSLSSVSATSNGTLSSQQGTLGQYLGFSGAPAGTYVTVPDNDKLDIFSRNMTLSAWFRFSQQQENYFSGTAYYGSIAGKGWLANVPDGGYGLFTVNDSISWQVRKDPVNTFLVSPLAYRDGQWHNAVGVLARGSSPNLLLYIDGVLVNSTTNSSIDSQSLNSTFGFDIGVSEGTPGSYRFYFNGSIDEVRLYNRSLSAAEIRQLYLSNLRKLNSTSWEFVTNQTNLSDGTYAYAGYSTDSYGYTDSTGLRSVTLAYNPVVSSYGGDTTDFASVADITNVTNLTLEKTGTGKIKFPATHSINAGGQNYDSNVIIGNGFISVNSSALDSSFNSTATLTLNLAGVYSGATAPAIYYYEPFASSLATIVNGGTVCSAPRCTGVSWNPSTQILAFNVTGFSDYGVNGSGNYSGAGSSPSNSTGTLGINITSTNQIAVYTSSANNNSALSFIPVTPPAAGSITLMSNESSNVTGGDTGFLVENQGNVNVSITVASDKNAASFIGGSGPLFQMFGGVNESGACPVLNESMQNLSGSEITVCPSLAFSDSQDTIWAYVLVKIDSDSPPQTSTATLTFTSTQA